MNVEKQVRDYISIQPEAKKADMEVLHRQIMEALPESKLWFIDGKNSEGKVVANPSIGYGFYTINYANGTSKAFYQIGLSGNTTGISVYILGLADKTHLSRVYGKTLGKASVTGYCIKFKTIKDINTEVLLTAIKDGAEATASRKG